MSVHIPDFVLSHIPKEYYLFQVPGNAYIKDVITYKKPNTQNSKIEIYLDVQSKCFTIEFSVKMDDGWKVHRQYWLGPAQIYLSYKGDVVLQRYVHRGFLHRPLDYGPAVIRPDTEEYWYKNISYSKDGDEFSVLNADGIEEILPRHVKESVYRGEYCSDGGSR